MLHCLEPGLSGEQGRPSPALKTSQWKTTLESVTGHRAERSKQSSAIHMHQQLSPGILPNNRQPERQTYANTSSATHMHQQLSPWYTPKQVTHLRQHLQMKEPSDPGLPGTLSSSLCPAKTLPWVRCPGLMWNTPGRVIGRSWWLLARKKKAGRLNRKLWAMAAQRVSGRP